MCLARVFVAAALLFARVGHAAGFQQTDEPAIADFLVTIGGSAEMKTVGSRSDMIGLELRPFIRDRPELAGYRLFRAKHGSDRIDIAQRARSSFINECEAKGGHLEADDGPVVKAFASRKLISATNQRSYAYLDEIVAVCSDRSNRPLGAFLAIVYDAARASPGRIRADSILSRLSIGRIRTAVYAYKASSVVSRDDLDRVAIRARFDQQRRAATYESERNAETIFRRDMAVGTQTNCGTVIRVQGSMVEVGLPPYRITPNGQSTFWSRREAVYPPGSVVFTFGL